MQLTPDYNDSQYIIHSYQRGKLLINDKTYSCSIIIMPDQLITDWRPQAFGELTKDDLTAILTLAPELCLLGTGDKIQFLETKLIQEFITKKIGLEVMDTSAACRTFNLLASEGRRVAAALLLN